ncbi:MAG TPA: hypothetical protein PKH75_11570 [Bacillota bacterium]|jgi:hypothetical protein|nr:hypothetical protein [Bacillota bacterium]
MVQSLSAIVHQYKLVVVLLGLLIVLPLICIVGFPYFLSLTVPPDRLEVYEITEQKALGGTIIHLDEQNIQEFPVLEEVLLRSEPYPSGPSYKEGDLRRVGEVEYPEKITQWTIDTYVIDNATGKRRYFEYEGHYYRVGTIYVD